MNYLRINPSSNSIPVESFLCRNDTLRIIANFLLPKPSCCYRFLLLSSITEPGIQEQMCNHGYFKFKSEKIKPLVLYQNTIGVYFISGKSKIKPYLSEVI